MFAIYKREIKSCFCSIVGPLFVGITLFFPGLYFTVYCLMSGSPYYSYVVGSIGFLFLISVPILTMRLLAEEKRNKTDQLILTAPVTVGAIVVGKFLAMLTVFAIPTAITCFYPLILTFFGSVPMGECYLAILGFFLFGMACIAIGELVSSLTESQVIAAVICFGVLFLGYMMSSLCGLLPNGPLTTVLGCFDMYTPMENLLNGTLDVSSVVYFFTLTVLALFLTVQSIQKRRYSVSVKHFSMGAYSTVGIVVALAIAVVLNLVVRELPGTWTSIDLTGQKLYSLTDQTKDFLAKLQDDVKVYVIVREDDQDTLLGQTLQRYEDLSSHITVEYVDPTLNPTFHTQYTDQGITMNSMIFVSEKRSTVVDYTDVYESTFDYQTYTSTTTGYDGEGQITSALSYVTADDMPKMYLTQGHGEYELSADFKTSLDKGNVIYEDINLMDVDAVPEDAACLFINGPVSDFNTEDQEKVISYLERGGKVVAVTALTDEAMDNYYGILSYMGIDVVSDMVAEEDEEHYYMSPYYLLPNIGYGAYTTGIQGNYYIFAPYAQGLVIEDEEAEGMTYRTFLYTSDKAFAKKNLTAENAIVKEEGDVEGPFDIGVEAVKTIAAPTGDGGVADAGEAGDGGVADAGEAGDSGVADAGEAGDGGGSDADGAADAGGADAEPIEATLVAISCDQMFTDAASQVVSGANRLLFTNIVGAFCDYEVNASVPVKSYEVSTLMVPQASIITIGAIVTVVLPLVSCLAGFVVWFRRRKR